MYRHRTQLYYIIKQYTTYRLHVSDITVAIIGLYLTYRVTVLHNQCI